MNARKWLQKLVSYDTTSNKSNLSLINAIKEFTDSLSLPSVLLYNEDQKKANLIVSVNALDTVTQDNGLLLSGHTDTVPTTNQKWHTNPYEAIERDEKVFGRGTTDMKGFIAVILALLPEFLTLKLKAPIHLAFSYDEEIGCKGTLPIVNYLKENDINPALCIVGEPSSMQPVIAHKGIQDYEVIITGKAMHSSLIASATNAIDYAAKLICFIRQLADDIRIKGPFDQYFDVPYTSISTNLINGGIAANIVPGETKFIFEIRNLPNDKPQNMIEEITDYINTKLLPEMRLESDLTNIEIIKKAQLPAFSNNQKTNAIETVYKLLQTEDIKKVAYATEAGIFNQHGISTIICGPGNIKEAHIPNEYIEINQLKKCEEFLLSLVTEMLT